MVVRFLLSLVVLFTPTFALAEHAAGPVAPSTRAAAPAASDTIKNFLDTYRNGKLTRAERERFIELLGKKEAADREFLLMLMKTGDPKMETANDFAYQFVTDPRVAESFKAPSTFKTAPAKYEGPSMSAAPKKSAWEIRRDDPLQKCQRKCAHDKIFLNGPWWGFNPGGGPYWQCMAQCDWDYRHGKLY